MFDGCADSSSSASSSSKRPRLEQIPAANLDADDPLDDDDEVSVMASLGLKEPSLLENVCALFRLKLLLVKFWSVRQPLVDRQVQQPMLKGVV